MTPSQFAQSQCANHVSGECISRKDGVCIVDVERCGYFEQCVLPLADADGFLFRDDAKDARGKYEVKNGILVSERTRFCECGASLPKRRRLCDSCRAKHLRERSRAQMQKRRSPVI